MIDNTLLAVICVVALIICMLMHQRKQQLEEFRVKERAYSACLLPANCAQKVAEIPKMNLGISNPFLWPYSGAVNPEAAHLKFAPVIPIMHPESHDIQHRGEITSGGIADHIELSS